ncbi:hypothetical protein FRUB_05304 [Fimbriiglobus ruber]|uniref:Uncharacterized protein n=1 Tax=Fimbriiglobus ruber TaxID=1908690 RepID=A0A225DVQ6_9BACT|nr:hypothetical protein FRUB_05304 [Fimbriiglobus ruber]
MLGQEPIQITKGLAHQGHVVGRPGQVPPGAEVVVFRDSDQ